MSESAHACFQASYDYRYIAEGFAEADVIVEREFRTASVHQGYIEPHAVVAMWNEDSRLKIWTSTQGSFNCRASNADM